MVDAPQDADIILMLNTPGESQGEAPLQALVRTVDTSARNLPEFVSAMGYYKDRGYIVACADVAYANGADLKLVPLLKRSIPLERLDGYAAWNTAGNTLGTVVAHATARFLARELDLGLESEAAHLEFLLLRFADDWAYQAVVRPQIGTWKWRLRPPTDAPRSAHGTTQEREGHDSHPLLFRGLSAIRECSSCTNSMRCLYRPA